jgi:hypothetical protein
MSSSNEPADQKGDGQQQQKGITGLMDSLALATTQQPRRKDIKDKYAFWESQPVMQFNDEAKVGNHSSRNCSSSTDGHVSAVSLLPDERGFSMATQAKYARFHCIHLPPSNPLQHASVFARFAACT